MESSVVNASLCESETTTTTTATLIEATTTNSTNVTTTTTTASPTTTMEIGLQTTSSMSNVSDPLIPLYAVIGVVGGVILIGGVGALIWRLRNPLPPPRQRRVAKPVEMKPSKQKQDQEQQPPPGTVYGDLEDAPPLQTGDDRYGAHLAEKESARG